MKLLWGSETWALPSWLSGRWGWGPSGLGHLLRLVWPGAGGPRRSPGALLFVGALVGFHQYGRNGMWKYPERCRLEAGSKLILERPQEVKCEKKFLKHRGHKAADWHGL